MKVITSVKEFQSLRSRLSGRVGFVPTMGALHTGHASLLERSRKENDVSVLSIFVNPTQFNDSSDFKNYPKTIDADLEMARRQSVDYVLIPDANEVYGDDFAYKVKEDRLSKIMEGAHRPGHFDGVLTVVLKLFGMVSPDRAYFGEKDYQQLQLIAKMVRAFFLPIEIVACPTVREQDGLALSSRNVRLSSQGRAKAPLLYRSISSGERLDTIKSNLQSQGFKVDYVEDFEGRRFAAASIENVRLIDNVRL